MKYNIKVIRTIVCGSTGCEICPFDKYGDRCGTVVRNLPYNKVMEAILSARKNNQSLYEYYEINATISKGKEFLYTVELR